MVINFFILIFFFITELKLLHLQSKISVRHAFAQGTTQNLKIQWETYFMFCFYFGFQSLPSSVKVLTLYAQFLSKSFVSVQSIKNYISGVKTLHLYTENEFPQKDTFDIKRLSRLKSTLSKTSVTDYSRHIIRIL